MSNFSQMLGNRAEAQRIYEQRKKIKQLERKLQQKENIIKEVREYIKDACYLDEINYPNSLGHKQTMKVLEILDKENKGE